MGAATKQDIYSEDDLKVAIIRANTDVKVDGEICYVSCLNVEPLLILACDWKCDCIR